MWIQISYYYKSEYPDNETTSQSHELTKFGTHAEYMEKKQNTLLPP